MKIEPYKYFLEVVRAGSFSSAAKNLFISQQGLSSSVKSLENKLGVTLIDRKGRKIRLTEAGSTLVPLAEKHVASHERLIRKMNAFSLSEHRDERISLYAMPYTVALLRSLSQGFHEETANKTVIIEKTLTEIIDLLGSCNPREPRLALAVIPSEKIADLVEKSGLNITPLFESHLVIKGTDGFLSSGKKEMRREEILELPMDIFKDEVLKDLIQQLFSENQQGNVLSRTSNTEIRDKNVAAGISATFCDTFQKHLIESRSEYLYIPIKDAPSFVVAFMWSDKVALKPGDSLFVKRFCSFLSSNYGNWVIGKNVYPKTHHIPCSDVLKSSLELMRANSEVGKNVYPKTT